MVVTTALSLASLAAVAPHAGATAPPPTVTYTNTQTIAVPPASSYAGSGGGDGWGLAFSSTEVFNVFHHQGTLQVACHLQTDASDCYQPVTVQDADGHNFGSSGHPGMYFDTASSKLYTYATRDDGTAGVVCFDSLHATTSPMCGFTALTAVGGAYYPGMSNLGDAVKLGDKLYSYNYVPNASNVGDQNALLCFDLSTKAACAAQPFAVAFQGTTFSPYYFPEPQVAAIGGDLIVDNVSDAGDQLSCFDTVTGATCSGTWPVAAPAGYSSNAGAMFPLLSSNGNLRGFCLPTGVDPCWSLTGATLPTPAGMPAAIPASDGWNGQAVVLGGRVYLANGNYDQVFCYDASTDAQCTNLPKSFSNLGYIYTTTLDPQRPTCIWVNADSGSEQIQNFDAYTGGACGEGPIRVLASSFVVNAPACTPGSYTTLAISQPARNTYSSGSVKFLDADANPLPFADRPIDGSGAVDLTGLNLNSSNGLPQFLITLNGASGDPTSVTTTLTWRGTYDATCAAGGTTVVNSPQAITFTSTPPATPVKGGTYNVAATGGGSGNPVTFTIDPTSTAGACTVADHGNSTGTVSFTGTGSCIIDANQAAGPGYTGAPQVKQSLVVVPTGGGGGGGAGTADLAAGVSAPANVHPGTPFQVTVTVRDLGPAKAGNTLTLVKIPFGFSVTAGGKKLGSFVQLPLPSGLAAGAQQTYVLTVVASGATSGTFKVYVASVTKDPNPANDTASTKVTSS